MAKKKILIVEDEPALVEMISIRLKANGYDVICAYNGQAGLELAENECPDLILLDILMPKLDGYAVCAQLKKNPPQSKIPIIILTAKVMKIDAIRAKECGADAYMTKPFQPDLLLDKIKELLP